MENEGSESDHAMHDDASLTEQEKQDIEQLRESEVQFEDEYDDEEEGELEDMSDLDNSYGEEAEDD